MPCSRSGRATGSGVRLAPLSPANDIADSDPEPLFSYAVERLRRDAPLNEADQATFYGGDERGYTDYPFLDDEA